MSTYKKYDEENPLFYNYVLTDLLLVKRNNRKKTIGNSTGVHLILADFLESYGIYLFANVVVEDLHLKSVKIPLDFPEENIPILHQIYGYKDIVVDIQLNGYDSCAYSFGFGTKDGRCELRRHVYGQETHTKRYANLKDLLEEVNSIGYESIFGLPERGE